PGVATADPSTPSGTDSASTSSTSSSGSSPTTGATSSASPPSTTTGSSTPAVTTSTGGLTTDANSGLAETLSSPAVTKPSNRSTSLQFSRSTLGIDQTETKTSALRPNATALTTGATAPLEGPRVAFAVPTTV